MDLEVIELDGTVSEMGEAFGERCRGEIRDLCGRRIASARAFALERAGRHVSEADLLHRAHACMRIASAWDPEGWTEFLGIARGAGIDPDRLYVMQGLTDFRDLLSGSFSPDAEGCSAFAINAGLAADGNALIGQSWDLLTDNMEFVRLVHRRPATGPETCSLTLTGCLSLIGMNSHGLAVGTTNLNTTDTRDGVHYLSILHRVLRCAGLREATDVITMSPRMAAHYYLLAHPEAEAVGIECSGHRSCVIPMSDAFMVHCNHALKPEIREVECGRRSQSTCCRQIRLGQLLHSHRGRITIEDLKTMLSDHEGGDNALCRHHVPPDGTSTNACVIISPSTGEIHACRGQAHVGTWKTIKMKLRS